MQACAEVSDGRRPDVIAAVATQRYSISQERNSKRTVYRRRALSPDTEVTPMRLTTRHALTLAMAALPTPLFSQGLTIQSVNDIRFLGSLGTLVNMAARFGGGGNMHDIPTTTYLSGHKMRTESENTATIIDADAGRFITIDNAKKTYSSMTFDEMAEIMRQAQEGAKQEQAKRANEPKSSSSSSKSTDKKTDLNVKYKVETDRPGDREKIAGYNAERMFLTITMEGEAKEEGKQAEQVGSMVLLIDNWISKDAPQSQAMAEFQRAYAQKAGEAFKEQAKGLQAAFNVNPQLKGGLEAASKEMAKLQGTPLRSRVYVTLVPPNTPFDRKLALGDASAGEAAAKAEDAKPKSGGGFGGLVGKLKAAAEEANKQDKNDKNKSSEPPKQGTIMTMKNEVQTITTGPVSADLFGPPAGYREIKRPLSGGGSH
jgi:hypothetical protein